MSRKKTSFTDFSELLLVDLERIFRNDTTWTRRDLMAFHRTICDLCCTVLIESRRSQEAGKKVYLALKNFLTIRLKSIVEELESINDDQELLCEYASCWKSYQTSVTVLDIGCSYLNENWVKREMFEDRDDVYTIYRLGMILWKSDLFKPIDRSLINAIHHTMVEEIHDQPIKCSMIYTVLQSIVDIFSNDVNQSCSVLEKMTNVFQSKVIKFFESESKKLFRSMLESDLRAELKLFVTCAILYKPAIEPDLCNILSAHLECLLKNAIDRCGGLNYERDYVQAIWGLRKVPLLRAFADRIQFLAKADHVCVKVINKITEGKQEGNPPLILARYCHKLMLHTPSSESEENTLRNELKRIVEVVLFLSDENRKSFTNDYFALLKKRCIDDTSASDKNESLLISMLRKDLGSDFEVKARIERNEMVASNGIQAKCQEFLVGIGLKLQIDFRIKFFKVRQLQDSINGIRLPVELEQFVNEFRLFWSKEFNRYGFNFHPLKSWGELTMNSSSQKCYTLRVNTLQMALLLQFNHQNTFVVQELAENVGTSPETLIRVMCPLINRKLLIASENSAALTPTSSITMCSDYNNKRSLINFVNSIAAMSHKPKTTERNMHMEELDAAIVRIMEREKQLERSRLIYKVTKEPKHHSSPIKFIKARIEHFLKNKYLELSSDKNLIKVSKI